MNWSTWTVEEVVWSLAAFPGLVLWLRNRIEARRTLNGVDAAKLTNGRRLWARFALQLTTFFLLTETVYLAIGVAAGFTEPENPSGDVRTPLGVVTVAGLIGASVGITLLALAWMRVHKALIHMADERDDTRDAERDPARDQLRDEQRDIVRDDPRDDARDFARDVARDPTRDQDRDLQRDVFRDPPRDAARDDAANA